MKQEEIIAPEKREGEEVCLVYTNYRHYCSNIDDMLDRIEVELSGLKEKLYKSKAPETIDTPTIKTPEGEFRVKTYALGVKVKWYETITNPAETLRKIKAISASCFLAAIKAPGNKIFWRKLPEIRVDLVNDVHDEPYFLFVNRCRFATNAEEYKIGQA